MNDVDRSSRHLCQGDRTRHGLSLGRCRPGERVILWRFLPFGQRLLNDHVDRTAVFGVHADEPAIFRSRLQRTEDAGVIEHEHTGIGHEKLEAGHAFIHQGIHLLQLTVADVCNDAVKGIVADGFLRSFVHPRFECFA